MRVFILDPGIVKNPRFLTKSLEQYGEIVPIFDHMFPLNPLDTPAGLRALQRGLEGKGFDPFNDYICLTGPFHAINLLIWAVARTYEPIRVLMFDARNERYYEAVFSESIDTIREVQNAHNA